MKRIISIVIASFAFCFSVLAQCTPDQGITTPGLYPAPDSLPCAERGVAYSEVVQIRIPATFQGFNIDSIIISGITGFPAGISYTCNPPSCNFSSTATGCILLSGTTNDPAGDYDLVLNATAYAFGFGIPVADSLLANNGYDLHLLVIEQGAGCRTGLAVAISGDDSFCPGGSASLTADVANSAGTVTYSWSSGATTQSISVSSAGTYSVTVTDQNGTATASFDVAAAPVPVAGFTFVVYGQNGVFTDTSSGNPDTYAWDFGDPNSSSNTSAFANPSHAFSDTGTYTVTVVVTNSCGSDDAAQQVTISSLSACQPDTVTRAPGVYPSPDSITCIERGVPYDFTMQTANFDSFSFTLGTFAVDVNVNWTRIDSLGNFPCGITWEADKPQYGPGEKGCIYISGLSKELVGQYPLKIYMTMSFSALGQTLEQGGEITDLISQLENLTGQSLGLDLAYVSRVIEAGDNCPGRDTSSTLTASGTTCPALSVEIGGNTVICTGSTTLTANPQFYNGSLSGVTYQWSPGGQTTQSINVTTADTYSVVVNDQSGTATTSVTVTTGTTPTAGFTATTSGAIATITQNSSTGGATAYSWNWGDNSAPGSGQIPPPHTYASNGTFTITLTATNSCGNDQATQQVTTTGVFIRPIENNLKFVVYPNPSSGYFNLSLVNNSAKPVVLRVFDLSGKLVYSEPINEANTVVKKQLNLSSLPKGVYTLHLSSEAGNGIQRLTIY